MFGGKSKLMLYPLKSDGSFCGGVVGATGEKMCVKRSCTVAKHKTKVEVIPICDRESESGQYVYISENGIFFPTPYGGLPSKGSRVGRAGYWVSIHHKSLTGVSARRTPPQLGKVLTFVPVVSSLGRSGIAGTFLTTTPVRDTELQ